MLSIICFFAILILILYIIKKNDIYETYVNSYKIIKPTCNKETIFRSINKLDNELGELTFLINKNKQLSNKYDEMYKWYEKKRKLESMNKSVNEQKRKEGKKKYERALKREQDKAYKLTLEKKKNGNL